MTRNQLIKNIEGGYAYRFEELPAEHLDKNLIRAWLSGTDGALAKVPKHLVDDDIRRHAITKPNEDMDIDDSALKSISMDDTQCYEELALLALDQTEWNMEFVDHALYSEAFFLKALKVNPQAMTHFFSEWTENRVEITWTEAMIHSAVSQSLDYLPHFDRSQVKKESLELLISEGQYNSLQIARAGLLDVMSDMIGNGYWPKWLKKPSSLSDSLNFLLNPNETAEALTVYYAFVRHYPMEDVLPLMKSSKLQGLMLEIYSAEELMPHLRTGLLKGHAKVRGKLLEQGLGL
jgi:hypothetical protein